MDNKDSRFKELLREASWYRFFSLCFQPPRESLKGEIEAICKELGKEKNFFKSLLNKEDLEDRHHRTIGSGGVCSPCESEYIGDRLGGKGKILADVAGFYRAFSFNPQIELRDSADNIAIELSFMSYITLKLAYAFFRDEKEEMEICSDGREKFQKEHLSLWIHLFAKKLNEVAEGSFYERIAMMVEDFVKIGS